ncbi:MAG: NADH-quinone oxidoreductase subunit C [Bryobacterales bacterium]|nr:NADH-quinone oxidoreductase subunit C [Bryobacterales bacterium]
MITDAAATHPIVVALQQESSSWLVSASIAFDELTIEVLADRVMHVCRFLRDERQFNRISTVTAVDRYPAEPRFEVVYHLHSLPLGGRVRVKARVASANPELDSVTAVWPGANWYEREVFDMFGIRFRNHPQLTRILMPEGWLGHPLRRDYPVHGHRYDYAEPEGGSTL